MHQNLHEVAQQYHALCGIKQIIRVAPYPNPILFALAQLQAGLMGLKHVRLGGRSPTYKALDSAV